MEFEIRVDGPLTLKDTYEDPDGNKVLVFDLVTTNLPPEVDRWIMGQEPFSDHLYKVIQEVMIARVLSDAVIKER